MEKKTEPSFVHIVSTAKKEHGLAFSWWMYAALEPQTVYTDDMD